LESSIIPGKSAYNGELCIPNGVKQFGMFRDRLAKFSQMFRLWQWLIFFIAALFSIPALSVFSALFESQNAIWDHIKQTVLSDYLANSFILVVGVGVGTLLLGVSTAWLTSLCRFPAKRVFSWMLLLPMAMPAYVIAYTYTGLLDFAGPVQSYLRAVMGWGYGDYWFPEVRSIGGAITMLSLVLYPYVYLMARAAFIEQSICVLEVSRTLGCSPWQSFRRVAVPLARPAIVAGLSLVLMETLADYGTVSYFGISVFTTGIFRTWFGMGDEVAAAKLAAMLLTFIFTLVVLERVSRAKAQYHHTSTKYSQLPEYRLSKGRAVLAMLVCAIPVVLGFVLPATILGVWTVETYASMVDKHFFVLAWNSFSLAAIAAIISVFVALILAYGKRLFPSSMIKVAVRVSGMGYAIPGTVVAVGVMVPFAWLDNTLDSYARANWGFSTGLILSGTAIALIFAYVVRFLAVSLQAIESGLGKIKHSMDDAARSLGCSPAQSLYRVHIPLMKGSVLTALLIVFVDIMKELPATLILRPFNFNTLAVRAFELASDERLADASSAALMIVVTGLVPVLMLSYSITFSRAGANS
tara:strand:- start:17877 stop:19619 length:1743 start_codon:yes stop_codon:yes gene_type:complete